jgi:hypothetical protein
MHAALGATINTDAATCVRVLTAHTEAIRGRCQNLHLVDVPTGRTLAIFR